MAYVPILLYVLAWVIAKVKVFYGDDIFTFALISQLFLFSVGIGGIWNFLGYLFYPQKMQDHMGWQTHPLPREVGLVYLSFGVLGIISYFHQSFWIPTVVAISIFFLGDAIGFIIEMVYERKWDKSMRTSQFILNIVLPLTIIITMVLA